MSRLSAEDDAKPFRLRIPMASPRERYKSIGSGRRFEKKERWYPVTAEEKAKYSKVLLFDTNPSSPPLFQIVTKEEARRIDIEENIAGASNEAAAAQREAKLQAQLDEAHAKLKEQAIALEVVMTNQARTETRMEELLGMLKEKFIPRADSRLEGTTGTVEAKQEAKLEETKIEPKPETKVEPKPARPGERRDGNKKPAKAEAKPDDDKAEAKEASDAEVSASDAYDSSLKAEGFTLNR